MNCHQSAMWVGYGVLDLWVGIDAPQFRYPPPFRYLLIPSEDIREHPGNPVANIDRILKACGNLDIARQPAQRADDPTTRIPRTDSRMS
jgi:hypothetical protein